VGLVTSNPVTHSDLPKVQKHIGLALARQEQDVLAGAQVGPWCLPVFLEMADAIGARRGEVLAARWADIIGSPFHLTRSLSQTKQGLEFKNTKTEKPRVIELPPSMLARLEAHRIRQNEYRRQYGPDYRSDLDLIFCNTDGTPLRPDSISGTVSRMCRDLGLPKGASLHTVRHSHASLLLSEGVDIVTVSARMGHSNVRTTAEIYAHAIRGKDQAAAQVWDDIMERARGGKSKGVN
jgi:integrase